MSNALLADVEARAERRRTRTRAEMWQELVERTWRQASATLDPAEKRRLLERAHRLVPADGTVGIALAGMLLVAGEWDRGAALFSAMAEQHGIAEAWAGLATCAHLSGDSATAERALVHALHCRAPDDTLRGLADVIAPGKWCGLDTDGVVHCARPAEIRLDGVLLGGCSTGGSVPLPAGWRASTTVEVLLASGPALASPLPVRAFAATDGFVQAAEGGVTGWAWCPADPARDPGLTAIGPLGECAFTAARRAENVEDMAPLARPRQFSLSATAVARLGTPLQIRGLNGRNLLGSPLDPGIEARSGTGAAGFIPVWADVIGGPAQARRRATCVDVVIPVYGGCAETLACIGSVLATLPRGARLIVVDDASPDPALLDALQSLARRRRITLLRMAENGGFPRAANAGLQAAAGRDVVLLNSDTLVPPGWLERLRAAAYSATDIGTVTPFSNDATILSYPDPAGGNPAPDLAGTAATDQVAQRANGTATIDLPVGVGFCLYLRRDCLDQVGLLREDLFAQGYGEENDLCLRARHQGWRNVAAPGVYVAHVGAASFGAARAHLVRRNAGILNRLHPGHDALIADHLQTDPLRDARHRMDGLVWAARRRRGRPGSTIIITHGGGGGVDRVIDERAAAAQASGQRVIIIRPWRSPAGALGVRLDEPGAAITPNLTFLMPDELPKLVRLLRADRPRGVELHHMLGHHAELGSLAARLGVPMVSVVHDYARFCPRIALVSTERRYCGEPDVAGCEACIADLGSLLEDDPAVPALIARSAVELQSASRVIAPSLDAAARIRRHFPGIAPVVEPWGDDRELARLDPAPESGIRRVAIIGAIGVEKGFEVLLACARDARRRSLPLAFVVVGYTADDERLMQAGPVHVTGEYKESEAVALVRAQGAQLAFIPSVWPETWCFALTRAWDAGLAAAVFDLGAQAERVRNTGRGWLLPLGLPASRINDALLRLAPGQPTGHSPPTSS